MEIKIPLSVSNLVFLGVGLYIGFSCSAHATTDEQMKQLILREREREQQLSALGKTNVHFHLYGSPDPCLANIEKICAEIDGNLIDSQTGAARGLLVEKHNTLFNPPTP